MKNKTCIIILLSLCFFALSIIAGGCINEQPNAVILDTDLSSDVDDVGAVALLHSLVQEDNAKILAMMVSSGDQWSVRCLKAINGFFEKPNIPVGQVQGKSVGDDSKYTKRIAREFGGINQDNVLSEDSVALYRRILAGQPDHSVTVITIGYLTNLKNLLDSQADLYSPLSGSVLIKKKVKKLVTMGGEYPKGREWNFYRDVPSTSFVIENWPTPVVFCGFEVGKNILTGKKLKNTKAPNPVRSSYTLYNGLSDRPSWDQVTVLFALKDSYGYTKQPFFKTMNGKNTFSPGGYNNWEADDTGNQSYIIPQVSTSRLKTIIEDRMVSAVERVMR